MVLVLEDHDLQFLLNPSLMTIKSFDEGLQALATKISLLTPHGEAVGDDLGNHATAHGQQAADNDRDGFRDFGVNGRVCHCILPFRELNITPSVQSQPRDFSAASPKSETAIVGSPPAAPLWYNWRMQTLEFTRGLQEIVRELKIRELTALLQGWLKDPIINMQEQNKDSFAALMFDSRAGYDRLFRVEATRKILLGLSVEEIYESARMRRLLNLVSNAPQTANIRTPEMYDFFETLRSFLKVETTSTSLLETEKVGRVEPSNGILELQLIDYDGSGIEPARLLRVMSVLTRLHMNLARVLGVQDSKLRLKYLDSGSDVIMAIEGAKAVIESMGNLFLQFWDKIKFRHHDTFERDIEALSKGLEFVTKVQEAVEKQAVTEEEAKILKTRVFREVDQLVGLGVTLPLKNSTVDQRQLLIEKRDTKLLGTGLKTEEDGDEDSESET